MRHMRMYPCPYLFIFQLSANTSRPPDPAREIRKFSGLSLHNLLLSFGFFEILQHSTRGRELSFMLSNGGASALLLHSGKY